MPEKNKTINKHLIEEKFNSITHSIGAGMSIAGLIFLIVLTRMNSGGVLRYVSFSLYGAFQIMLYLSSSLTHLFTDYPKIHAPLRVVDQASVYLLIAGTYTPISLIALPDPWGWWVFGIIWGIAFAGILMKTVFLRGRNIASDLLYLPMGWLIIVAFKPLREVSPPGFIMWTILGGGLYTGGIVFYLWKKLPFSHVLWHLFVLAGGISFFLGFAFYLT
ncbi:MAG: hemolysin III family protein [Spirochaetaceae bacterium]|nr:hemolysin III family protein [Spirochaetaceae bacterium]RKX74169.1 MAG: hemolysin III family protein [Spirochaetota bacterium]RKX79173.1 MAG: hemolysin III family protein [Spirochaetota bacterium]RKX84168.1 MAG: hemolysin III family protein [Spirochaetota bacterium]